MNCNIYKGCGTQPYGNAFFMFFTFPCLFFVFFVKFFVCLVVKEITTKNTKLTQSSQYSINNSFYSPVILCYIVLNVYYYQCFFHVFTFPCLYFVFFVKFFVCLVVKEITTKNTKFTIFH
jgi:hypothetical protein